MAEILHVQKWQEVDHWGHCRTLVDHPCKVFTASGSTRDDRDDAKEGVTRVTNPVLGNSPRTLLEELVARHRWTYKEVAAHFTATARRLGSDVTITERHLRRLASGDRSSTSTATARVLEAQFGHSVEQLLARTLAVTSPRSSPVPATTDPYISSEELIIMAAQQAKQFTIFSPSPLPVEVVEQVREDVARLCVAYPQLPLSEILADLTQTQGSVFALLEQKQRPAEARHLYLLAAIVSGMLAKVSHDMADPYAAATQARAAFTAAEMADHNGLRAWIRGLQSLIAYWSGRYADSVRYAQEGQRYSSTGSAAAWLPVSEARAWAVVGHEENTQQCLARADAMSENLGRDELDELGGICSFTRPRHLYYAADALAWLPQQAAEAAQRAQEAVDAYSDRTSADWAFGDEAGSRTDLAIARIGLGDLEGAAQALEQVMALPVQLRINGIVRSVQHVERALSAAYPHPDPAVTALREQMDDFTRTSLSSSAR